MFFLLEIHNDILCKKKKRVFFNKLVSKPTHTFTSERTIYKAEHII